jgi:hypothetical protein
MWTVTRRSLKNRSAARVAGEFFKPKICTLTIRCPNIMIFPAFIFNILPGVRPSPTPLPRENEGIPHI